MARRELLSPPPFALDTAPMTGEAAAAAAAAAPALAAATATGCFFKPGATTAAAAAGVLLLGVEGFLAGGVPATGNSRAGTRGGGRDWKGTQRADKRLHTSEVRRTYRGRP